MALIAASTLGLLLGLVAGPGLALADTSCETPRPREVRRAWRAYVRRFVQPDGRVIDLSDGGVSTSEGQAYGLIRAVWADDRPSFDRMLDWTRDNLQHGDPAALPAWRWGDAGNGVWGVISENPAADADQWMAYALLIAAEQWDEPRYRGQALGLLAAIWEQEVGMVGPHRVVLPGPWARGGEPLHLNPSYFLPFAYRAFAVADPERPWGELVDGSYALLSTLMADEALPPDWVWMDPITGTVQPTPADAPENADLHGFEAFRVAWTLAADVRWYDEGRARTLLLAYARLGTVWRREGRLAAQMRTDTLEPQSDGVSMGQYGALIAAWSVIRPDDVSALFARDVGPSRGVGGWGGEDDYYGQNWSWLGVALWAGLAVPPEASR
jgi:endoglucanase